MFIKDIKAIRVLDSRGYPTLKTFVWTKNAVGTAIVPSGTSAGQKEAFELRDKSTRYLGQDVSKAIKNVNTIIKKKLLGEFVVDQSTIDTLLINLDGTENKSKLGGNAILSVSQAVLRAAANELNMVDYEYVASLNKSKSKMPLPQLNIINGGRHAGNDLSFQEFQIVPKFKTIEENIRASVEIYLTLKKILEKKYGRSAINVGYEGGFCPQISCAKDALSLIQDAIDKCKYTKEVFLAIDAAASEIYNNKKYLVDSKKYTSLEMIDYYKNIIKEYKLFSLEDPFSEDDKKTWSLFLKEIKSKTKIIGDDLLATNSKLIKEAIKKKYCNSLLLKINQIGTITEAIEAFNIAKDAKWNVQVSHRSGDTEDFFVSDLAYGLGSDSVKFGAPARGERTSKYNRLLEIEAFKR